MSEANASPVGRSHQVMTRTRILIAAVVILVVAGAVTGWKMLAGQESTDDAKVDVEFDGEPRARRTFHPGRGMPVRPIGLRFRGQHCAPVIAMDSTGS